MTMFSLMRGINILRAVVLVAALSTGVSTVLAQTPLADGQVIKIDPAAGKITIKLWSAQTIRHARRHDHGLSRRRPRYAGGGQARR
jgi:Cu/Ag efflux protein CusF